MQVEIDTQLVYVPSHDLNEPYPAKYRDVQSGNVLLGKTCAPIAMHLSSISNFDRQTRHEPHFLRNTVAHSEFYHHRKRLR